MVQYRDLERCKGPSLEDSSPSWLIDFEGFGKALMKKYWEYDCGQVEGDEIQEIALEYGLIVKVPYDPEKHGDGGLEFGLEKGDEWYIPAWKEEKNAKVGT